MRKHLLFAIFGFLVMLGTFLLFWQETHQEWKQIQRAFSALRLQQVTDSPGKERSVQAQYPFSQEKIAIRQLYIEPLRRTDRCTTCHLGIDDPRWQGAPQPFTTHPPPLLRFHPPQKYGCTICHRGQGLAITTAAAHGQTKHWNEPLLPKQYLEASCGLCHSGPDFRAAPVLSEGRRLVRWLGCPGCHEIRGYPPEKIGPSLAFIGSKVRPGWLLRYLQDPSWYSPQSRMPDYKLSPEEAEALTAFLLTLRRPSGDPPQAPEIENSPEVLAQGKALIVKGGCVTCHAIAGIPSPGFFPSPQPGGDLRPLARKVTPDWLVTFFTDREAVQPASRMPYYRFTASEVRSIVAYLLSQDTPPPGQQAFAFSPSPEKVATGRKLVIRYNCTGCHEIPGVEGGNPGPPLTTIGNRPLARLDFGPHPKGAERSLYTWLFAKVMTPRTFRETLWMPYFRLSIAQTDALVTFLLGQVAEEVPAAYRADRSPPPPSSPLLPGGKVGELLERYRCLQCHTIAGKGTKVGPDLTSVGSRVQKSWLIRYLQDPFPLRPLLQARMPDLGLEESEASLLADYFTLALVDSRLPAESPLLPPLTPAEEQQGKRLFGRKYGCNACHQLGGEGGRVGPDLTGVAQRLQPAWLLRYLQQPQSLVPDTLMPDLGLPAEEVNILARYLWHFRKDEEQ